MVRSLSVILPARFLFLCSVVAFGRVPTAVRATGTGLDTSTYTKVIHVATTGTDSVSGLDPRSPLRTVAAALVQSRTHLNASHGVKILIQPGVYRESATLHINGRGLSPAGREALLIVQGAREGGVVIAGSVSWPASSWTSQPCAPFTYRRPWPYRFETASTCEPGSDACLNDRNETVFHNGRLLVQRLSKITLSPNTFFIDDTNRQVFIRLDRAMAATDSIEAAHLLGLLRITEKNNIVLRNLIFRHEASWIMGHLNDGDGWGVAVCLRAGRTRSRNLLIEGCEFNDCNAAAIKLLDWDDVTIRRSKANNNGWKGMGLSSCVNVLVQDCETSYNAWRQQWVRGSGVDAAGIKIIADNRRITLHRHYAKDNTGASGIWPDWGNTDILLDSCLLEDHAFYPLYFEASAGPLTVINSTVRNAPYGFVIHGHSNIRIEDCRFENIAGSIGWFISDNRSIDNQQLLNTHVRIRRCYFDGGKSFSPEQDARWAETFATFDVDSNYYRLRSGQPDHPLFPDSTATAITYFQWQTRGKDRNSAWSVQTLPGSAKGEL